jgi:hypothetical protein
MFVISDPVIR